MIVHLDSKLSNVIFDSEMNMIIIVDFISSRIGLKLDSFPPCPPGQRECSKESDELTSSKTNAIPLRPAETRGFRARQVLASSVLENPAIGMWNPCITFLFVHGA
jgi:serine/threonine protein kinase